MTFEKKRFISIFVSFEEKAESGCKKGQFNCSDGSMCIEENWKCDGDFDCLDHSDEKNCGERTHEPTMCSKTDFTCASKDQCIRKSWECDGDRDCIDGSDEGPQCKLTMTLTFVVITEMR